MYVVGVGWGGVLFVRRQVRPGFDAGSTRQFFAPGICYSIIILIIIIRLLRIRVDE